MSELGFRENIAIFFWIPSLAITVLYTLMIGVGVRAKITSDLADWWNAWERFAVAGAVTNFACSLVLLTFIATNTTRAGQGGNLLLTTMGGSLTLSVIVLAFVAYKRKFFERWWYR